MKQLLIYIFVLLSVSLKGQNCQMTSLKSVVKGSTEYEITQTFDSENRLLSKTETRSIQGGSYTTEERYFYNPKGFLSSISSYQNGTLRLEKFFEYDALGKLISEVEAKPGELQPLKRVSVLSNQREQLYYESDGSVSGREVIVKNENGDLTLKEIRGKENQLYQSSEYVYAPNGEVVYNKNVDVLGEITREKFTDLNAIGQPEKDSTLVNGDLESITLFEYSPSGKLVKQIGKDGGHRTIYEIEYVLNEQGLPAEENYFYQSVLNNSKKYLYSQGQKIKEEQFNQDGELMRTLTWTYNCN